MGKYKIPSGIIRFFMENVSSRDLYGRRQKRFQGDNEVLSKNHSGKALACQSHIKALSPNREYDN